LFLSLPGPNRYSGGYGMMGLWC